MSIQQVVTNLRDDVAFTYSVENDDVVNMQLVLRAHGYCHTYAYACEVIDCRLMQA